MSDFPEKGFALVTGGSGGVGAEICKALAAAGSDVALIYNKNAGAAQATVDAITALGRTAEAGSVDLRDEAGVKGFVAAVAARGGGIHTVVTAHGPLVPMRHVSQTESALFRDVIEADLFGSFHVLSAALPHLREARGSIVTISTPAVHRTILRYLMSSTPKAAIEAMMRQIAAEEGRFGVRANAIAVGLLSDGMGKTLVEGGTLPPGYVEASLRAIALRRLGTAKEIGDAVTFLASERASWITGQVLAVDGGFNL